MLQKIIEYSEKLGINVCIEMSPDRLVPEERIRAFCEENKCGSYGRNYCCPPHAGSLEGIRAELSEYSNGFLFQYSKEMDIKKDWKKVVRSKDDFHEMILKIEDFLRTEGIEKVAGFIGGNCGLCHECALLKEKPCRHPEQARRSLEAIGIDVVGLLDSVGLDSRFHSDRITWTGCVLY